MSNSTSSPLSDSVQQSVIFTPQVDPFIGKSIGHCQVIEKISEGGTAHIYKAFNNTFKLYRVLKILKSSLSEDQEFYVRFIQEAQLTARLDHPNILRVFDTGVVDGNFFIEMEYIEGRTLRTLISENRKLSEQEILHIGSQVAKALEYAHNVKIKTSAGSLITGILHRDIKPENIMITNDRKVKLMDFGAAKPLSITSNTMQGMIVGTFHYMSPEQIEGKQLDVRSDFFSLGIVLYELLTNQKPFSSDKLVTLIETIKACKYKPVRKIRPAISPITEELIDRMLSRNANLRPRSAKEIDESIQICIQAYTAWGTGKSIRIPFSIKQYLPAIALIISFAALGISLFNLIYETRIIPKTGSTFNGASISPLEKGRVAENKGLWLEAVSVYELVQPPNKGGLANEYLEAQVRRARICFSELNQFTKARAILEKLRNEYSDPAIDAYLGIIYFKLALYSEALERLNAAITSNKGSVIQQTEESRQQLLYFYADALDHQYVYIEANPSVLIEAVKAWKYYGESAGCANKSSRECSYAKDRIKELEKIQTRQK